MPFEGLYQNSTTFINNFITQLITMSGIFPIKLKQNEHEESYENEIRQNRTSNIDY